MSVTLPRNIDGLLSQQLAFEPEALAAGTKTGATIDRGNALSASVAILTSATTGSPTSFTITTKLQHGDQSDGSDMADFTDNTPASENTKVASTASAATQWGIDLSSAKRYVRVSFDVAFVGGSTPTVGVAMSMALGGLASIRAT